MSPSWLCIAVLLVAGLAAGEIQNVGWWKNTVFYQVYPRSFMDSNDDGIGDLKGITSKLQHFVDAGIGAIWLSPIYASPMVDFGYDISDFCNVDKAYGTMEDFENLTRTAKQLGIKVIMDLVPNHTSDKHYWFIQSFNGVGKYKDYYMWHEGKSNNTKPPNNWLSIFSGSAWMYNATRGLWYYHLFEYRQPDLNFTNPNVREEMEQVIRFWLGKGIDGFRVDASLHIYEVDGLPDEPRSNAAWATPQDYGYLDHPYTKNDQRTYELIASWRKIVDDWANSKNEDEKIIMTESYTDILNTTKYYDYGTHVPFNFFFITEVSNKSKPSDFQKVIDLWMEHMPPSATPNWVMGNHDRSRLASRYPGRVNQMIMLPMILPGIAVTYYGEEIGMKDKQGITWKETQDPQACNTDPEHYQFHSRDPFRAPMQWDNSTNAGFSRANKTWLPVNENYITVNLEAQKVQNESHYKLYQTLTKLRSTSEALKSGSLITEVLNHDKALAVVRQSPGEGIVLLINFSNTESQRFDISDYLPDATDATVVVSSLGSGIKWGSSVKVEDVDLPPKASLVLSAETS